MKKIMIILSLAFATSTALADENLFQATEKRMITRKNPTIHGTCTAAAEAATVSAQASCYMAGYKTCEEIDAVVLISPNGTVSNIDYCMVKSTVEGK